MQRNALIVEDDPDIVELLRIHMADLGCAISVAHDGRTGLEMALAEAYDLMVLDVTLPGMEGTEICRRIRGKDIDTPILMLTARSEEFDKVLGLEMGADDYITKPFSIREFIARVKALLRRAERQNVPTSAPKAVTYRYGELTIDLDKRKVARGGVRIDLSPKEFELLTLLASNPGKSFDRGKILSLIWGYDFEGYEHTVNSHINRLRTKIEPDAQQPIYILTNWGVGYRFNEDL
ncbi:response regulator transcription factor [Neolewinella lacunae]|uniref:Phosphate regulon transcriptional regulatory protein PhoB n=1 Tax=Neolewinella lacunae TaxID=1517758 RepID=A0A923PG82_9BACT|nr:response regulator transcription factor [Neolewinella lacunae]MBC6993497.1 response regulator transcription factor [Neolewinella lacunae]MDN3636227.1 response regulator transcription factor [Neolewinella lacunae]